MCINILISLGSKGPTDLLPFNSFSSPITFSESYTHEFMTRALSPLSILHATLPLFRNRKAIGSPKESNSNTLRGASVILCVPAAARVGVLGSSSNSMANAAVVQGFKVLKREAALDPSLEDTNLRFITLDVGEFRLQKESKKKLGTARTPTDIRVLTNTLLGIVNSSRRPWSLQWLWTVWLGSRRSVGAGGTFRHCFIASCRSTPLMLIPISISSRMNSNDVCGCIAASDSSSRLPSVTTSPPYSATRIPPGRSRNATPNPCACS